MYSKLAIHYAILGFITHAVFILLASVLGWRTTPLITGDTVTYLQDAENILKHGVFSREINAPYLWEPYRTPGYPVLLAFSKQAFGNVEVALYFAAVGAGLAAWVAVQMAASLGCERIGQHVAGLCMTMLPNSLGLSARLLTDAIFGYLFLFWIYLIYIGFSKQDKSFLVASVLDLFILQSLKPTLNFGVLFILGLAILGARNRKGYFIAGLLACFSLVLPITFSVMNYRDNGIFSPSLLGIETVREYLQVRYLAEQTGQDEEQVTKQVRLQDLNSAELLSIPESLYGRLYLVKKAEVERFVKEHPLNALGLMGSEMIRQFVAPQEFALLVFWEDPPLWVRIFGSSLTLLLWGCASWGAWKMAMQGNLCSMLVLLGTLAFFLVTGSVSHFVGARLRFPADLVAIPYFSYGLSVFWLEHFHISVKSL